MKNLPPDIDRMLWEIAESGDAHAFDQFEQRFPHLVGELGKRVEMVRLLKGSSPTKAQSARIPHFELRDPKSLPQPISKGIWAAGAAALCTLAAASFMVTRLLLAKPAPLPTPPKIETAPIEVPDLVVNKPVTKPTPAPPSTVVPTENPPVVQEQPAYLKPQDLKLDRAHLLTALKLVASAGKLNLEIAPNMPDPEIRLEYHRMNAIQIFTDLGQRFGFTPFDQGNGGVLIVPARDKMAPAESSASGSAELLPESNITPVATDPSKLKPTITKSSDGSSKRG